MILLVLHASFLLFKSYCLQLLEKPQDVKSRAQSTLISMLFIFLEHAKVQASNAMQVLPQSSIQVKGAIQERGEHTRASTNRFSMKCKVLTRTNQDLVQRGMQTLTIYFYKDS